MKQIHISIPDEDYGVLSQAAVADDRKVNNFVWSQIIRPWVETERKNLSTPLDQ